MCSSTALSCTTTTTSSTTATNATTSTPFTSTSTTTAITTTYNTPNTTTTNTTTTTTSTTTSRTATSITTTVLHQFSINRNVERWLSRNKIVSSRSTSFFFVSSKRLSCLSFPGLFNFHSSPRSRSKSKIIHKYLNKH